MKMAKILVPLDGSALAETAIPTAVRFAKDRGAPVVLVRSVEGPWLLGSVAESVLRGTSTPILLLRATGAAVLPPDGRARRVETANA